MTDEIINRVAKSPLEVFDLEDYYPEGKRMIFDLRDFLFEGWVLKEKDFRHQLEKHHWEDYKDAYVAICNSTDAIVPAWAFMLVASKLQPYVKKVIKGDLDTLETILFQEVISQLNLSHLKDKPVIIKGCSRKPIPENAYLMAVERIQPIAKSVMYGEACSSVPVYKKSN